MDSLPFYNEATLLEEYEDVMEVEEAAATGPNTNSSTSSKIEEGAVVADVSSPGDKMTLATSPNGGNTVQVASCNASDQMPLATSPNGGNTVQVAFGNQSNQMTLPTSPSGGIRVEASSTKNPGPVPGPNEGSGLKTARTSAKQIQQICRLCRNSHSLIVCPVFKEMSHEKRIRMVLLHGYCSRCLSPRHIARDCQSPGKCGICKGKHHSQLHSSQHDQLKRSAKRRLNRSQRNEKPVPSSSAPVVSLPLRTLITFSPTLKVNLVNGKRIIPVRAALDLCCSRSYICESLVRQLNIPAFSVGPEKLCSVIIRSIHDPAQLLTLMVKVTKMNGIATPIQSVPDSIKISFEGLQLADPNFNVSGQVALVIGPEVAPQILKGTIFSNPGLPLAQYTIFGWVISGQSPL